MRARPKPWSFDTVSVPPSEGAPGHVEHRMRCSKCGTEESRSARERLNPEMIIKGFARLGWITDLTNKRLCVCPACRSNKKAKDTEDMTAKVTQLPVPSAAPKLEAKAPRESITPDQKAAIRRLLDSHFDDSKGMYLDGYSDQKIDEEVDVPWSFVKGIREAAYGEIRVDPALAEFQRQLLDMEGRFGKVIERAESVANEAKNAIRDMQALRNRIAEHAGSRK